MLTQSNSLPPRVPHMGYRAFIDAFGRYIATGEIMDVERQRESQDDPEHGPLPCVEASCEREDCVTYRTRALAAYPTGFSVCPTGNAGSGCEGCTC